MYVAALAPVRVPADRQGGPRTNCAAGWSRVKCRQEVLDIEQRTGFVAGPARVYGLVRWCQTARS
jgi:hypothetical protein